MNDYTVTSDPGIDDLVALVLLYKLNSTAKNVLISTFGNATEKITSINAKEFIAFVANSWEFLNGSSLPLNGKIERPWPDYFHGSDGAWGVHPRVDLQVVKNAKTTCKNIISLATLTDPLRLVKTGEIEKITLMGGAFNIEGNETKYAETNMAFDPDAAKYFFESVKKIEVKVVPLDVTRKVYWSKQQVDDVPENGKVNIWLKKLLLAWFDKYNHDREKDFNLHDPLAVFLNFYPELAEWVNRGISVIIEGEKRGQTVFDNRNPSCAIAIDIKNPTAIANSIYNKIFFES
ncbi:MAG: hypothetical protein COU69_02950 [Candidatus Pacebacteria bacterium CG10_big_fil_rev_8_21_14_0_10_56_10]|nr:MAG: hypothetical protein COU69_02950 [Candidatus Pacebacteria bacterium CG10_big_fil_rev_8_21_14_0_10_56_10]